MSDTVTERALIRFHELHPQPSGRSELETVSRFQLDKPTVICLGGLDAAAVLRARNFAEDSCCDLLGEDYVGNGKMRLYTVSYDAPIFDAPEQTVKDYQLNGTRSEACKTADAIAAKLVHEAIAPALPDAKGLHDGDREKALEKTESAMGNINFLCFSFGSVLLRYVHTRMDGMLADKGYDAGERKRLMRHVKGLTLAELAHWQYPAPEEWHFKTVHLTSHEDELAKPMIPAGSVEFNDQPAVFEKPAENMLLIHARLPKESMLVTDRKRLLEFNDGTGHSAALHTRQRFTGRLGSMLVTTMLQSVMRNMLVSSEEGREVARPEDLLQSAKIRTNGNAADYLGNAEGYRYTDRINPLFASMRQTQR